MSSPHSSSGVVTVGKRIASEFSQKNVTFMAAGIAYNAFVSLAPLLILLLLIVTVVGGGLEDRLISVASSSFPGPIADVVTEIFSAESAATGASVVGLVVLLWGTLKLFRGLDTAFSEIYETEESNSFVDQIVDGIVVLVALVLAIVATVAVSAVFSAFAESVPFVGYLTPLVLIGGLILAFFPMYYRFPDADVGWRDVLPGAVLAAVGWAAFQSVFQVYLTFKSGGSASFFGGVVVIVTWLYFSGMVLLLGAVLNAVVGGHSSGSPGGVGRGAGLHGEGDGDSAAETSGDVENRLTLTDDDLASYLRDLRSRVTGHYEEMESDTELVERDRSEVDEVVVSEYAGTLRKVRPMPSEASPVEVVERSRRHGDGVERSVTIRWQTDERESDE
jgi:membrane protein